MKENIPYTKIKVGDVIQLDQSLFKTGKEPKYLSIQRKHLTEMNVLHYYFNYCFIKYLILLLC